MSLEQDTAGIALDPADLDLAADAAVEKKLSGKWARVNTRQNLDALHARLTDGRLQWEAEIAAARTDCARAVRAAEAERDQRIAAAREELREIDEVSGAIDPCRRRLAEAQN